MAALAEDGAAYRLAIERLLAAKASRDKQIAASIAERNKLAQLLARNRVADRESDGRRLSADSLSSGSARRVSGASTRDDEQQQRQPSTAVGDKREAVAGAEAAVDTAQSKSGQSMAATPRVRRTALSPVSPNSLTTPHSAQRAATAISTRKADSGVAERPLMARVSDSLSNSSMDASTAAALNDSSTSPTAAGWLSRKEAVHERHASERTRKTIQLLEDKCHQLDKVVATARRRQHNTTARGSERQRLSASDLMPLPAFNCSIRRLLPLLSHVVLGGVLLCAAVCPASVGAVCGQSLADGSLPARLRRATPGGEKAQGSRSGQPAVATRWSAVDAVRRDGHSVQGERSTLRLPLSDHASIRVHSQCLAKCERRQVPESNHTGRVSNYRPAQPLPLDRFYARLLATSRCWQAAQRATHTWTWRWVTCTAGRCMLTCLVTRYSCVASSVARALISWPICLRLPRCFELTVVCNTFFGRTE